MNNLLIIIANLLPFKVKVNIFRTQDTFTHGTSEQRRKWFLKGWKTGKLEQGDTFRSDL
jgi:predicted metalloprotease